ncbi:hypothetical protein H8S37_13010 [Mediterraneibacter sp. NSJ-55]|uniref:Chloramphenicol resistance protein n=1 Tax=Mediterraneibacter hominis TaxID=2763054 RepID=A0A923LKX8_9FIRM|nr:hypothetical protein [Mediterraneibacter hominis]MBC5689829.1 hypothetical protein [Mediterraneibacter hominis]
MSNKTMQKPVISSICEYIMSCPFMENGKVDIPSLEEGMPYSIDLADEGKIYKKYTDGTCIRQIIFKLSSIALYDAQLRQKIVKDGFPQYFEEWLEEQRAEEKYPTLSGYTPIDIQIIEDGWAFSEKEETARFQLIGRFIYK